MKSIWSRQSCLFAVALAAGVAGAWSELQAQSEPQKSVSEAIIALSPDFGTFVQISENGDGTAVTAVFTPISDCEFLGVVVFDSTDYEISVDLKPGQGGKGTGSGTGHF
ncbi:MAG: hypothetical protein C4547_03910, partial [Phycisphaerales bacterium]